MKDDTTTNKELTIGEVLNAEADLLKRYTLEELEANPELIDFLPEEEREGFLQKQRAWKKIQEENREALDELRDELRRTTAAYTRLKAQAMEKYDITEEELDALLVNDPDANRVSLGEFVDLSMTSEEKLQIGGLLDTILKKSRKEKRPVQEIIAEAQNALEQPGVAIKKYLQDPNAFMVAPLPRGLEHFLSINAAGEIKRIYDNIEIGFEKRLGIDEQKINGLIRISFSNANYYAATNGLKTYVELPFLETLRKLKKKPTEANIKKYRQRLLKEILPSVAHQSINVKDKKGAWHHMEIGGGYFHIDRRNDRIIFQISDSYAYYLSNAPLTQYSSITFELGDQNNPLPFYLALKLQDHYFSDGNRARSTNCILSVKKILEFCADTIPNYEYIQATDPGHWVREIKDRLEKALNDIQSGGLFKWEYCRQGMAEVTESEKKTKDYWEWSRLYITFKLIPAEPDQTQRLQNKQARIEAAKEKNAAKKGDKSTRRLGTDEPVKRDKPARKRDKPARS